MSDYETVFQISKIPVDPWILIPIILVIAGCALILGVITNNYKVRGRVIFGMFFLIISTWAFMIIVDSYSTYGAVVVEPYKNDYYETKEGAVNRISQKTDDSGEEIYVITINGENLTVYDTSNKNTKKKDLKDIFRTAGKKDLKLSIDYRDLGPDEENNSNFCSVMRISMEKE